MRDDEKTDADELFRKLKARGDEQAAANLAAAKEKQHAQGKEPFDLDALVRVYDTSSEAGHLGNRESRQRQYEVYYYLLYPEVMTLEQFANAKAKNDLWRN